MTEVCRTGSVGDANLEEVQNEVHPSVGAEEYNERENAKIILEEGSVEQQGTANKVCGTSSVGEEVRRSCQSIWRSKLS